MSEIKGDMTIYELMENYPKAGQAMAERGLMCGGCPMAMMETIEMGAAAHGVDPKDLLKDLNKIVSQGDDPKGPEVNDNE